MSNPKGKLFSKWNDDVTATVEIYIEKLIEIVFQLHIDYEENELTRIKSG